MGAMPIPMPQATATSGAQPAAKAAVGVATPAGTAPQIPTTTTATPAANPYIPGATTTADPNQANLNKQETDIYGKGVGGEISNLLSSIGGVDSSSLQNYIASLQPQMATASANLHSVEGAQGVSGNSSVAALGQANLQAQETSAIAGESAQLQQSGQQLEASILTGQQQQAAQEVAQSGWSVFGDVLGAVGTDSGSIMGGVAKLIDA